MQCLACVLGASEHVLGLQCVPIGQGSVSCCLRWRCWRWLSIFVFPSVRSEVVAVGGFLGGASEASLQDGGGAWTWGRGFDLVRHILARSGAIFASILDIAVWYTHFSEVCAVVGVSLSGSRLSRSQSCQTLLLHAVWVSDHECTLSINDGSGHSSLACYVVASPSVCCTLPPGPVRFAYQLPRYVFCGVCCMWIVPCLCLSIISCCHMCDPNAAL